MANHGGFDLNGQKLYATMSREGLGASRGAVPGDSMEEYTTRRSFC